MRRRARRSTSGKPESQPLLEKVTALIRSPYRFSDLVRWASELHAASKRHDVRLTDLEAQLRRLEDSVRPVPDITRQLARIHSKQDQLSAGFTALKQTIVALEAAASRVQRLEQRLPAFEQRLPLLERAIVRLDQDAAGARLQKEVGSLKSLLDAERHRIDEIAKTLRRAVADAEAVARAVVAQAIEEQNNPANALARAEHLTAALAGTIDRN